LTKSGLGRAEVERISRECRERGEKDREKLERMMLYGQSAACRWKLLHEYFDESWEEGAEGCDNCDNCLYPLEEQLGLPDQSKVAAYRKPSASSTESGEEKPEIDLSKGDQVSVKKYGEGEVKAVEDDKVIISFPDGQTRTFKKDFVE